MIIQTTKQNGILVAEVTPPDACIQTDSALLQLVGDMFYENANHIILCEQQLPSAFFDLSTGLAGAFLQKFVNYQMKVAIVGDFSAYASSSLPAFIRECNRGNQIFFCASRDEALARLTKEEQQTSI